jgi:hypothetical protein
LALGDTDSLAQLNGEFLKIELRWILHDVSP